MLAIVGFTLIHTNRNCKIYRDAFTIPIFSFKVQDFISLESGEVGNPARIRRAADEHGEASQWSPLNIKFVVLRDQMTEHSPDQLATVDDIINEVKVRMSELFQVKTTDPGGVFIKPNCDNETDDGRCWSLAPKWNCLTRWLDIKVPMQYLHTRNVCRATSDQSVDCQPEGGPGISDSNFLIFVTNLYGKQRVDVQERGGETEGVYCSTTLSLSPPPPSLSLSLARLRYLEMTHRFSTHCLQVFQFIWSWQIRCIEPFVSIFRKKSCIDASCWKSRSTHMYQ